MSYNKFDVVKAKKSDEFIDLNDHVLVQMTQRDVDEYRDKCFWICPKCGYRIKYITSLLISGKNYIHEMKCPDEIEDSKTFARCKGKMILKRNDDLPFDSIYFNELFARYQDRIVWESMKSFAVDSPDEVYSTLIAAFLKIVLQFARDKSFTSKSDKWFSSFFWRSVQNKIADLQKTNTYNKRCPTVKCALCGQGVGQITARHLSLPGHEKILERIIINHGKFSLESSGEIECYNSYANRDSVISERCLLIGSREFNKKSKMEKKRMFDAECLDMYSKMFPNALFKNNVSSINANLNEDSDTEFLEVSNDSVFGERNVHTDEIEMNSSMSLLSDIIVESIDGELDLFLEASVSNEQLKRIIYDTLLLKSSFVKERENSKVDIMIDGVKKGFTNNLLAMIRSNDECRICMGKSIKKEELSTA